MQDKDDKTFDLRKMSEKSQEMYENILKREKEKPISRKAFFQVLETVIKPEKDAQEEDDE